MRKFFNRYFHGENSIKGATGILIVTLTLSNLLGLIRDHYLAQKIPTDILDTYYAAFRLPDLVFNLLILGAIASAFIPVFTAYISRKKIAEAWHIVNSFISIAFVAVLISLGILFLLMPYLVPLLVPAFSPEKQELTLKLARLMLLSPIFFSLSYIFGGILNSFRRFLIYSIAPLVYNLSIILGTIFWADKIGVYGPTIGVVCGSALHMIVQIPSCIALGWRPRILFDWANEGVRKIIKLMVPRTIGLGANQLMLLAFTAIASALGGGAVAIFNLADNIQTMPTVVFGTSFATAIFPVLSRAASLGQKETFLAYVNRAIRGILYLLIPATVIFILLRAQIIRLILGSGYFGWEQTVTAASTLGLFSLSLVFSGIVPLFARSFYAQHDTKTPMTISIISILVSIISAYGLSKTSMGVAGLALAFTFGSFVNAILLYWLFRIKIGKLPQAELFNYVIRIVLASAIMAIVIEIAKYLAVYIVDMQRFWGVASQTLIALVLGVMIYLLMTGFLGCEEVKEILFLRRKGAEANREPITPDETG